jgi:hypothetical protein
MQKAKTIFVSLSMIISLFPNASVARGIIQGLTSDDNPTLIIKGLWSPDDSKRQEAKQAILRAGRKAIPQLVSLLSNILKNPQSHRFATGKEEEGAEASKNLNEVSSDYWFSLEISWRLKYDAVEMLGLLKADEAVPLLIEFMEKEESYNLMEKMNTAMDALVKIGQPSVPKLIQEIKTAHLKAANGLVRDSQYKMKEAEDRESILIETAKIQIRAAMVLGEIGELQALTVLEELLEPAADPFLLKLRKPYVEEALELIRKRQALPNKIN